MSEHPSSPDARVAAELEADQQLLHESLAYASQREVHEPTLKQHQARITEIVLTRPALRQETGQPVLGPVWTRIEAPPQPVPPPAPAPEASRPRLVVNGEEVPWPEPQPEAVHGGSERERDRAALYAAYTYRAQIPRQLNRPPTADEEAMVTAVQKRWRHREAERAAHGVEELEPWMALPMLTIEADAS